MVSYTISKCLRLDKPIKKNGKYPLYIRVRVDNKETKLPTQIDVRPEEWDIRKKELKSKPLRLLSDKLLVDLETKINRSLIEDNPLSIPLVKELYSGKSANKPEMDSFYDYYLEYVDRRRKEGLNPETIRVYMTTYNVLKAFREDFRICDIDLSLVEEFDAYMRDVNKNTAGGRQPKHKNLRSVILDIEKHITYHSSRHTFATLLVIDNVNIYKISKYLGHKSIGMTQRYLKYNLSIAKESAKDIDTFKKLGGV